jgi:SET domain
MAHRLGPRLRRQRADWPYNRGVSGSGLGRGSEPSACPSIRMNMPHGLTQAHREANGGPIRNFSQNLRKLRKCQHLYLAETAGRGIGVFAARPFTPGDIVMMDFDGDYYDQVMTYEELRKNNITLKYPLQVGPDLFRIPSGSIDDFINHSCNPNTGIRLYARGAMISAIRYIAVHDEVAFDYSTYLNNPYERIVCRCGSQNCRGVIGNFTSLPLNFQQRYLALRIVGDFALEEPAVDDALA